MIKVSKLCLVVLLTVWITTGCWNLKEPDQLAFSLGAGLDLLEDGQLQLSSQIVIPSGMGGQEGSIGKKNKTFRVVSATGRNVYDAVPNIQLQLPRSLFIGQRRIILIGQRLAEHGIDDLFDEFIRNPQSEMRSRIYVVKDADAKDILAATPIFESYSSTELVDKQEAIGLKSYYFRNFLSDALRPSLQPILPALSLSASKQTVYSGSAIFNKNDGLKLIGFLNTQEAAYANWITGRQKRLVVTSFVKRGQGTVSLKLHTLDRRIRVKIVNHEIKIEVRLKGKGTLVENNSNLNPTKENDLRIIQVELSRITQKSVQQLIEKVQKQYKTDIFGFGESVHRHYPSQWKALKKNWYATFPGLDVKVKVELQCSDPGEANSSIKIIP